MFRIAKSDEHIERRGLEDETADDGSWSEGSGSIVASSALRWLRGTKRPLERSVDLDSPARAALSSSDAALDDADGSDDDLELTGPLSLINSEYDDEDDEFEPSKEPYSADTNNNRTVARTTASAARLTYDLDDDDDIGDFDDLELSSPLPPLEEISFLPEIDLDDTRSVRDSSLSSPGDFAGTDDLAAIDVEAAAFEVVARRPDDIGEPEPADAVACADDPPTGLRTTEPLSAPLLGPSAPDETLDKLPQAELPNFDAPSYKLDDTSALSFEASLALQPIPELQTELKKPSTPSSETTKQAGDSLASLDHGERESGGFSPAVDALSDDHADHGAQPLDADFDQLDPLDIESLESTLSDGTGDDVSNDDIAKGDIENDWHAHLANVLNGEGDLGENKQSESGNGLSSAFATKGRAADRDEDPARMLTLSKPLVPSTTEHEDEGDLIGLPPSLLAGTRHKGQSTLPADTADLSPEQLSLGIIANVPRLRRFAAVQIGDESLADALVQSTIEIALGGSSVLEPNVDLGLALLTLLYQRRQEMLRKPAAPDCSPDAERAFESALCRGLAGADQFEINQFARAINELDERSRALLVLVALENLTYDQIAGIVQVPAEEIICNVAKARMKLRQVLASDETDMIGNPKAFDGPHAQEIEIHGYLDGELDGRHMADVDALIECDEDAADRLLQYGIQGDLIRRLYTSLLNRPIPGTMLKALAQAAKPTRWSFRFGPKRALIAGAAMIILGSGILWPFAAPALSGAISDAVAISLATLQR